VIRANAKNTRPGLTNNTTCFEFVDLGETPSHCYEVNVLCKRDGVGIGKFLILAFISTASSNLIFISISTASMPAISDSKAIIVGGTHGIGLATAELLVHEGATLIVTGRNHKKLRSVQAQLGDRVTVEECDITLTEAGSVIAAQVQKTFGSGPQLDLVFINAGYARLESVATVSEASFRRTFDTNVFGAFFVAQALSSLIKPEGSIVFTTSIANRRGIPGMSVYSASKAAVHSFVQSLAAELAARRVRVNSVSPGYIKTPTMGIEGTSGEDLDSFEKQGAQITPLGRVGTAEEVAKAVVFLGYEATFTTGSEIVIDGGLLSLEKVNH